jgi:glycine C-acetyltransferase
MTFSRHNSPRSLDQKLAGVSGRKLVAVEGVYSMDGDLCRLPEIVDVCKRHGARLLIDEAHSMFLFGPTGRGVVEHFQLANEVDFQVGTLSKALGGQGGYLAGSSELITYVAGFGRARFFSCNLSPTVTAGLIAGLEIITREPELRATLWRNVDYLKERLLDARVDIGDSAYPIIPLMIKDDVRIFSIGSKLQERGLFLQPIVYPAVPRNKSRLRIFVTAMLSRDDLDEAVDTITDVLAEEGIAPSATPVETHQNAF